MPERGEWVDLAPLAKPVLPVADRKWSASAKAMWKGWRADPVTSTYSPADLVAISELARRYDDLAPNEQRLRMDGLGLTPKGKRDLRYRVGGDVQSEPVVKLAEVRRLRAV